MKHVDNTNYSKYTNILSVDNQFFMKSLAFVATLEKSIVAVIIGTARFHNIIPIDIETKEEHRKKGLAYLLNNILLMSV